MSRFRSLNSSTTCCGASQEGQWMWRLSDLDLSYHTSYQSRFVYAKVHQIMDVFSFKVQCDAGYAVVAENLISTWIMFFASRSAAKYFSASPTSADEDIQKIRHVCPFQRTVRDRRACMVISQMSKLCIQCLRPPLARIFLNEGKQTRCGSLLQNSPYNILGFRPGAMTLMRAVFMKKVVTMLYHVRRVRLGRTKAGHSSHGTVSLHRAHPITASSRGVK
jgi:hypothetical protein